MPEVLMINKLGAFGAAKETAIREGTAYVPPAAPVGDFESMDKMEKGQVVQSQQPIETFDEAAAMGMPEFFVHCEEISSNTKKIKELTDKLEKLHREAINAVTTEASAEASTNIEVITAHINRLSNTNRSMLRGMEMENAEKREIAPAGSGHMRMREAKHRQLASAFMKVSRRLQKTQTESRERYQHQLERQYRIVNPHATAEEIAKVTSDPANAQVSIFAAAVKGEARKNLEQMKDRLQDVKIIEKSILELYQLFLDLQTMVVEQGAVLNRIEYNVDKTVSYTEQAAQDMKLSVEYQKSIWKKKWILTTLIIIGIVFLLLVLLYLLRPLFFLAARGSLL